MHCFVEMQLSAFLACQQPFFMHNLHEFKNGGVTIKVIASQGFMNIFYGGGALFPDDLEDLQFLFGGFWQVLFHTTNVFVYNLKSCNGNFQELLRIFSY